MTCDSRKCTLLLRDAQKLDLDNIKVVEKANGQIRLDFASTIPAPTALEKVVEKWKKPRPAPETPSCPDGCDCKIITTEWGSWEMTSVKAEYSAGGIDLIATTTAERRFGEGKGRCEAKGIEIASSIFVMSQIDLAVALNPEANLTSEDMVRFTKLFV